MGTHERLPVSDRSDGTSCLDILTFFFDCGNKRQRRLDETKQKISTRANLLLLAAAKAGRPPPRAARHGVRK